MLGLLCHLRRAARPPMDCIPNAPRIRCCGSGCCASARFRVAVSGNLFTRLGIGGIPFLLPLLYQVGLGFSPIQSGLLIMPQALAAMSLKLTMPLILKRFGYRRVLITNTIMLGIMILLFSTIDSATPVWLIVMMAFTYGFLTSLQYTSMNTLAYADVVAQEASGASTIASTVQQMAVSFGVATASLAAALFIPDHLRATAPQMIHGIHMALLALARTHHRVHHSCSRGCAPRTARRVSAVTKPPVQAAM